MSIPSKERRLCTVIANPQWALQVATLAANCAESGVEHIAIDAHEQGIVHIIGPEQGFTLPGLTLVCGDSHTATHNALGALAFGIGTSEVEHVFATQTLLLRKSAAMEVSVTGRLGFDVTAKDVALAIVGARGTSGGTGYVIEYTGDLIANLSVEGRMTACNMAIEAGAFAGLVAPDAKTFAYLGGRPRAPQGADWDAAVAYWSTLSTDAGAVHDRVGAIDGATIAPLATWGTSREDVVAITGTVPAPDSFADPYKATATAAALDYMGLAPGTPLASIATENVFIGICTNGRIEDLHAAAAVARVRHVAATVRQALVVPGSGLVKRLAEAEGLDRILIAAGLDWREPGCSMCLGMNPDQVPSGERCASTSNRNFVGRQGPGAQNPSAQPGNGGGGGDRPPDRRA